MTAPPPSPPPTSSANENQNYLINHHSSSSNKKKKKTSHVDALVKDGAATTTSATSSLPNVVDVDVDEETNICSEVRVISFDLDNTLWSTMDTIGAALQELDDFWRAKNVKFSEGRSTECVMKELFAANKTKYAPLLGEEATCPVCLTQLRLDAMEHILMQECNGPYTSEEARVLAQQAMEVMAKARHEAIPNHLADSVVETLVQLRQRLTSLCKEKTPVIMGAITDGNANPARVAMLAPYFDFCIQAEQVGATKPDARVFSHAVQQVLPQLQQQHQVHEGGNNNNNNSDEMPWWVHIGDDYAKDIVGAKEAGMRTIWCREFILPKLRASSLCPTMVKELSSWSSSSSCSTSTTSTNTTTTIDADDNNNNKSEDAADAIVDRFADLLTVLEEWHTRGQGNAKDNNNAV